MCMVMDDKVKYPHWVISKSSVYLSIFFIFLLKETWIFFHVSFNATGTGVCVCAFVRSKLLHYCTVLPTYPGNRMIKENKAFLYGSLCLYCGYCLCSSGAETLQPCQLKLPVTPTQIKHCHLWRPCIAFAYTGICKVDLIYVSVWQRVCYGMHNKV